MLLFHFKNWHLHRNVFFVNYFKVNFTHEIIVELKYFYSECRLGRRSHDHKLRQRKRHRFHEAFYEPWHRHSVQVAQKHAGPAVLIYESTCRRHLALCSSCLRFG